MTRLMLASGLAATAFAALAGCGGDKSATPKPTQVSTAGSESYIDRSLIAWRDCDGFECGEVTVPLDHEQTNGETIEIAVLRQRAREPERRIGVLILDAGGPGSSSMDFAREADYIFPREIVARFDIVGFDARGVGESSPLDCGDEYDNAFPTDYTPDDDAERQALLDEAREYAEACRRLGGDLLPHVGTVNVARDLELIREALAEESLSYFSYSYGTLAGAIYAELHPDRVRAFVLDAAIDPSLEYMEREIDQNVALERAFDAFLDDCAGRRACDFHSSGDPADAFDRLLSKLEDEPIPAHGYEGTVLTPDDLQSAVVSALYDRRSWPQLAFALVAALEDGDGTLLLDLAYPLEDEEVTSYGDIHTAIHCADAPGKDGAEGFDEIYDRLRRDAPRIGVSGAYLALPCAYWPAPASAMPREVDAEGAPAILVIGTTGDPVTPYKWSESLADALDSGVLLTFEGHSHTAAFTGESRCIDEAVTLYLVDLVTPDEDDFCD